MSEHDRLEAALARLGHEHAPPTGWQARVLAATRAARAPEHAPAPRRSWLGRVALDLRSRTALAAIAAVAIVVSRREPHPPGAVEIAVATRSVGPIMRGVGAKRMDVTARGGGPFRAVRVYRNETLVLECPGSPACLVADDATTALVSLELAGSYLFVALASTLPLPAAEGSLDADLAAANKLGVSSQVRSREVW